MLPRWKPIIEHLRPSLVLIALCVALYAASSNHTQTRPGAAVHVYSQKGSVVSPLLRKIFVGITYNWNVQKLVYLKLTIAVIRRYETAVDICIITNEPDKTREVLHKWQFPATRVCLFQSKVEDEEYALVWKHREVFIEALSSDVGYTMFMYLEDDTDVSWASIKSWALDTVILEPLGFMRGLVRTEFHPEDGVTALLDVDSRLNVSEWHRTVHAEVPKSKRCRVVNRQERYWLLREAPGNCVHEHYISLKQPFMGMWLATRSQLKRFRASPYWEKLASLAADKPDNAGGYGLVHWGLPERSTGMIQLMDVPDGFWSASVVPYDPETAMLLPVANIEHERNGYTIREGFRKIAASEALFT